MLDKLVCEMKKNNNIITTARALEIGVSKSLLTKYTKLGLIEWVRHGVYILPDSIYDDMYTLMLRSEYIVFSHESALFLLGLTVHLLNIRLPSLPISHCQERSKMNVSVTIYHQIFIK